MGSKIKKVIPEILLTAGTTLITGILASQTVRDYIRKSVDKLFARKESNFETEHYTLDDNEKDVFYRSS